MLGAVYPTHPDDLGNVDDDGGDNAYGLSRGRYYDGDGPSGPPRRARTMDTDDASFVRPPISPRGGSLPSAGLYVMRPPGMRPSSLSASARPKDYVALQWHGQNLVHDIKLGLILAQCSDELNFLDGLLAAYAASAAEPTLGSPPSRAARAQLSAQRYFHAVVEPVYPRLPHELKDRFRVRVEELRRQIVGSSADLPFSASPDSGGGGGDGGDGGGDDDHEHGLHDLTAAEAEAAVGNEDPDSPVLARRSSRRKDSIGSSPGSPPFPARLAQRRSSLAPHIGSAGHAPEDPRGTPAATPPTSLRSSARSDLSDDDDHASLYALPTRAPVSREAGGQRSPPPLLPPPQQPPSPPVPQPLLRTNTGLADDDDDLYQPPAPPARAPTWKDIAEGRWPPHPPPSSTPGLSPRDSLLPPEIERQQTDLPLPPPVSPPEPSHGRRSGIASSPPPLHQPQQLTGRPLRETYAYVDDTDRPLGLNRRAKFSWEQSPAASTIGDDDLESVAVEPEDYSKPRNINPPPLPPPSSQSLFMGLPSPPVWHAIRHEWWRIFSEPKCRYRPDLVPPGAARQSAQ